MTMVQQKWERSGSRSLSTVQVRALGQSRGKQVIKCVCYLLFPAYYLLSAVPVQWLTCFMFHVVGGMAGKFGGMRMDGEGAAHKKRSV